MPSEPQHDPQGTAAAGSEHTEPIDAQPTTRDDSSTGQTQEALRSAAAALRSADVRRPALKQIEVLKELQLDEDAAAVGAEIKDLLDAARAVAAGEQGDSGKYEKAALTIEKRWKLFMLIAGHTADDQPTLDMAEAFAAFTFKSRQLRSREERHGLGETLSVTHGCNTFLRV